MLFFWISLGLLALILGLGALLFTRLAFGPSPAHARSRPVERAARALNWLSFVAFLALASGALDRFELAFERSALSAGPLLIGLIGLLLAAALPFGALRRSSAAPKAASCLWLVGCVLSGSGLAAERLSLALAGPARAVETRLVDLRSQETRGAPRLSAGLLLPTGSPLANKRLLLPPSFAAELAPPGGAGTRVRLSFAVGPFGEPVALSLTQASSSAAPGP